MELLEQTYGTDAHNIDREAGVIRNVKLIGLKSRNGRRYLETALREAASMYEGAKCYLDHWRKSDDRPTKDHFGKFTNVRFEEGKGLFADLHYLKSHPEADTIVERAERMPDTFGLSHNAVGTTRVENGEVLVESIQQVNSVDIVSEPGTNASLFESSPPEKSTMKTTLKSLLARHQKTSRTRERLYEMVAADVVPEETEVEVQEESSPEDQLKAGLMAAIAKKLESATADELQKVLEIFGIEDSLTSTMGGGESEASEPATEDVPESYRRMEAKLVAMESKALLLESGREAKAAWVNALARCGSDGERRELLESFPQPQKQGVRPQRSPGRLMESAGRSEYEQEASALGNSRFA
ncbi:hypothetical protein [Rubinisphaera brasiliensis]|uniref:Uncharacterized protein n=1 Tax=Rubinisphaera brasiliensis (strain ATCC 49424 / DSM 5305 / JCM 21570 / IAM 15109 / NBRC 103401 / IFAM 1448) TaxID=756272 RepID=F0SNL6_RUBBR|nr:hypothetical protein [Rubinisphaera brasiliensis]ADY57850.1 hypothetical protein Plabr_0221 [Rubinisphaera brasiliensis DSM 5305]